MFHSILICTDFSHGLHRLTHFVPQLVAGGLCEITFLHVVQLSEEAEIPHIDREKIQQAHDRLSPALQNLPADINVRIEVQCGKVADIICKVVKTYHPDVVMLGSPNRTLLSETLFGSTTAELSQRLDVPLLVFRPQLISTYTSEELSLRCEHLFRCLLIPYDGSKGARYLVDRVKHRTLQRDVHALKRCVLCWVIEDSGHRGLTQEHQLRIAQTELTAAKATLESAEIEVQVEVRYGNAVVEILEAAQEEDVSAIAVSSNNLGKLMGWSVPSFTGEILRRSWHPVVFFPKQR